MANKKALVITTIAGFLPQFEMHHMEVLQRLGFEIIYASNFDNPIYHFDRKELEQKNIRLYPVPLSKFPQDMNENTETIKRLVQYNR